MYSDKLLPTFFIQRFLTFFYFFHKNAFFILVINVFNIYDSDHHRDLIFERPQLQALSRTQAP